MKLSTKIFLPIILISALLILLNGCFLTPSEEQPALTLYTVTYNGNENTGGEVPVDATLYKEGDLVTVLGNTGPKPLVNTGYDFYGWNTAADASGTARPVGYVFAMGTSDVTLYAMWDVAPALTLEEPFIGGGGGYVAPTVNLAPTITSSTITHAIVGVDYFYDVEATDPDGDTLTYSLVVKPSGMTIISATGVISWIPTAKGDYDVAVEVSDGPLSDIQSFIVVVVENQLPTADAGDNRIIVTRTLPLEVTFIGTGTDPDGTVDSYSWDFGDGNTSTGATATVSHAYSVLGTYTVTLTVTDNGGETSSDTMSLKIFDTIQGGIDASNPVNLIEVMELNILP